MSRLDAARDLPQRMLVDVNEACGLLGVRRTFLFGLLARGEIRSVKVGRLRKIARTDLDAYVERLRAEAGPGSGDAPAAPPLPPRRHHQNWSQQNEETTPKEAAGKHATS